MRLTAHTDFALRVLIYAASTNDRLCTIEEISNSYGISRNHLMKVVRRLAALGFLKTTRGRRGGLALARPASEIVVGEVVREMEDDFAQAECFRPERNQCPITPICGLKPLLGEALQAYLTVLDSKTVGDIAKNRAAFVELLGLDIDRAT